MANSIDIRPVAGAIGAEIHGLDLARELPAATIIEIRQVMHRITFKGDRSR